ncbi:sensor histidine kinase [Limnoglobus roseus]|uniref:histidine kinase n=1 Tax=Limnoglobus roseus TaxID=2598579 RepID=A0A5C1ACD5_9BACT|nr:HAMP domain-containing sensor histidine kinase [Limnoglobus roseus]QEL16400.1 PAS domain S-box protein [Limnoglobus roseus]
MRSRLISPVIERVMGSTLLATVGSEAGRAGDLLTTLAHELRSPLAAALYALAAMPDSANPDARRARMIAERQTARAARIIDDVFDVCAGCHGKLVLRQEIVDVSVIAERAIETVNHLMARSGHGLQVKRPPQPLLVLADPSRLEQVLTNLLSNAAKYTPPGGRISLTVGAEDKQIVLCIRDNGRGIEPHLLPRVFDLYSQGSRLAEQRTSGLGIGLALVKTLVELHGGHVSAFSDGPGTGAEFLVSLPAYRTGY